MTFEYFVEFGVFEICERTDIAVLCTSLKGKVNIFFSLKQYKLKRKSRRCAWLHHMTHLKQQKVIRRWA